VNIYYLFGKGTIDEVIYDMVDIKAQVVAQTLDNQEEHEFQMGRLKKDGKKLVEQQAKQRKSG